jgi:hypothetical protein
MISPVESCILFFETYETLTIKGAKLLELLVLAHGCEANHSGA